MNTFNPSKHQPELALDIQEGSLCARIPLANDDETSYINIQQSVDSQDVLDAVTALKEAGVDKAYASQSSILQDAQKRKLWGTEACELTSY